MKPIVVALVLSATAVLATPLAAQQPTPAPDARTGSQARIFQGDATRDDAPGLVKPVPVQSPRPVYTPEAMRSRVQGSVDVQIVVGTDGSVVRTRVVKVAWSGEGYGSTPFLEATPGLVENALTAAKGWTFRPGTLDGAPVPVMTTITLTFWLH